MFMLEKAKLEHDLIIELLQIRETECLVYV